MLDSGHLLHENKTAHRQLPRERIAHPFDRAPKMLDVLRSVAEKEAPDVRRLAPLVDRDLATIVAKALAKEKSQRYGSALSFAGDLDRWLRGEPVLARPLSTIYRLRKFLKRTRTAVRAGLVAALVVGLPPTRIAEWCTCSAPEF